MATLSPAELHDRLLFDRSRLRVLHDHMFPIAVRGHRSAEDAQEARAEVPWTDPNPPIHYVIEYEFDTLIAPGRRHRPTLIRIDVLANGDYPFTPPVGWLIDDAHPPFSPHFASGRWVCEGERFWIPGRTLLVDYACQVAKLLNFDEPPPSPGYTGWNMQALAHWRDELACRPLDPRSPNPGDRQQLQRGCESLTNPPRGRRGHRPVAPVQAGERHPTDTAVPPGLGDRVARFAPANSGVPAARCYGGRMHGRIVGSTLPLRPAPDGVLDLLEFETPDGQRVFVARRTFDVLERLERDAHPYESAGLLLGRAFTSGTEPYTVITGLVPPNPGELEATMSSVTITAEGKLAMAGRGHRQDPNADIVGWGHTHPTFAPFFSAVDMDEQRCWIEPTSVGIVISGLASATPRFRIYVGPDGREATRRQHEPDTFAPVGREHSRAPARVDRPSFARAGEPMDVERQPPPLLDPQAAPTDSALIDRRSQRKPRRSSHPRLEVRVRRQRALAVVIALIGVIVLCSAYIRLYDIAIDAQHTARVARDLVGQRVSIAPGAHGPRPRRSDRGPIRRRRWARHRPEPASADVDGGGDRDLIGAVALLALAIAAVVLAALDRRAAVRPPGAQRVRSRPPAPARQPMPPRFSGAVRSGPSPVAGYVLSGAFSARPRPRPAPGSTAGSRPRRGRSGWRAAGHSRAAHANAASAATRPSAMIDTLHSRAMASGYEIEAVQRSAPLIAGAGSLGQAVLQNLTLTGAKELRVVDRDEFEEQNRTRSVYFPTEPSGERSSRTGPP